MGGRTTLALLLVALLLGGALWWYDRPPDEQGHVAIDVLRGHRLADATEIRWQFRQQTARVVHREPGGRFVLAEPIRDFCSRARMVQILRSFDSAVMSEKPPQIADDQTGLDDPVLTFRATFADGERVELEFGGLGLTTAERFVRRDGVIYRAGTDLVSSLEASLDDLREHQVFQNTPATARRVVFDHLLPTGARERLVLESAGAKWLLMAPRQARTEEGPTLAFLQTLLGLRISMFPASVIRPPERDPEVVLEVEGELGSETVRLWHDQVGAMFGHIEGRGVDIQIDDKEGFAVLEYTESAMRARWLLPIENLATDLKRVILEPAEGGPRTVLERRGGESGFRLVEPIETLCADTPVAELVQALNNCRVLQFVDGDWTEERFGLRAGHLTVAAQGELAPAPTTLRIGKDGRIGDVEVTYAVRDDERDQVVAIPAQAAERLRRSWETYVRPDVLSVLGAGRLVLDRGDERRVFVADADGRWTREGTPGALPRVAELVGEFKDLRAQRAFGTRQLQPGPPSWTLSIERGTRGTRDRLLLVSVWDRGPGQPLWLQPDTKPDLVYEAKGYITDMLRGLWQD